MEALHAKILGMSENGIAINAAAARISTMEGTAFEILNKTRGAEKDRALIGKVMASGHRSIIEHHTFNLAFNEVSVLVEQFLIEFRLASFMVKSRRYVDFSGAGYYVPALPPALVAPYRKAMDGRFADYAALLEAGIPKEDARFVLPYGFLSNLYMTVNARELLHIICTMLYGRGYVYPEIRALGEELRAQFELVYPGLIEREAGRYSHRQSPISPYIHPPVAREASVQLLSAPTHAQQTLEAALALSGRYTMGELPSLLRDARPRELECLNYTFAFDHVSLSCITHFARHRIHSPLFPEIVSSLSRGGYVLPRTIARNAQARAVYEAAFAANARALEDMVQEGLTLHDAAYFALSGLTIPFMTTMNARELMHFTRLRACRRAQWEIQWLSRDMLAQLRDEFPALFSLYGPSCLIDGKCPEGRMTCGRPFESSDDFWNTTND